MYNIRLVRGSTWKNYQCRHYTVTTMIEYVRIETSDGVSLQIPDDGEAIYVMNDKGDTLDTFKR